MALYCCVGLCCLDACCGSRFYSESNSVFESDGKLYDLNKVFRSVLKKPTNSILVSQVSWILDKVGQLDIDRVRDADLSYPIIITYIDGKYIVVDGVHRLSKAVFKQKRTIKYKYVTAYELEDAFIKNV